MSATSNSADDPEMATEANKKRVVRKLTSDTLSADDDFSVGSADSSSGTTSDEELPAESNDDQDGEDIDLTRAEKFRDNLVAAIEHPYFLYPAAVICMTLLTIFGLWLLCLLFGWHTLCSPVRDCEPRNFWVNACLQIITWVFTFKAVCSLPWRVADYFHARGWTRRNHELGRNWHGNFDAGNAWYHVDQTTRRRLVALMLAECFFQFLNQGTRVIFMGYASSTTFPGIIWTNCFIFGAMVGGMTSTVGYFRATEKVKRQQPEQFGAAVVDRLKDSYRKHGSIHMWSALYRESFSSSTDMDEETGSDEDDSNTSVTGTRLEEV